MGSYPSTFGKATVNPIPNRTDKDQRVLLNFRRILLLSCTRILYYIVFKNRVKKYLENKYILVEEQNCFSKRLRYQLSTMATVSRNWLREGKTIFCCLIEFQKFLRE